MKEYEFTLKFALPAPQDKPGDYLDALFEQGCDDALVGTGIKGRIALDFSRTAKDAFSAIQTAIEDVILAIPGARLIEASPDLLGITDIAQLMGTSRQYMRKLAYGTEGFPLPVHEGTNALWHLHLVLEWLETNRKSAVDMSSLYEVATAAMRVNMEKEVEAFKHVARSGYK